MLNEQQTDNDLPNRLTCVFSNGNKLHAFRHSCDCKSPTLYLSENLSEGGRALASEPLDGNSDSWITIGESEFVTISGTGVSREPLVLAPALKGAA